MKFFLLNLFFVSILFSSEKIEPNDIPDLLTTAILLNECLQENNYCNPYIISFNSNKEKNKAKKVGFTFYNKRNIYCYNKKTCEKTLFSLNSIGIFNLDLGPFQLNQKYHKMKNLQNYFDFNKSKEKVKKILSSLINKYGYSWHTIGRYNSSTKKINKRYCRRLWKNINRIKNKY